MKPAYALFLLLLAPFAVPAADPAPVSAYASLPEVTSPRLSPNGDRLLVLRAIGDTQHAFVVNLSDGESNPVLAADPSRFFINYCTWANNDRLVCSIRMYGEIRSGRTGYYYNDRRTTFTRMIAVDADGGNRLQLIEEPMNEVNQRKWNATDQDNVISWLNDEPDWILVQLNRDDRLRPSVYRLNVYNNTLDRVRRYHDSIFRWYADRKGNLVFATGFAGITPVAYSVAGNRAKSMDISHFQGVSEPRILGASRDGKRTYVASYYGGNYYRIHEVDSATAQVVGTLFEDEEYDIFGGSLLLHPETYEPILLEY